MNEKMEVAAVDINQRLDALSAAAVGERGRAQTEAMQVYFAALHRLAVGGEFTAAEAIEFADAAKTAGKGATEQQADARIIANGLTARKFLDARGDLDEQLKITRDEIAAFESELSSFTEKLRLRAKPSFARLGELETLQNRRLSARREVENLDELLHPPTAAPPKPPTLLELQIRGAEGPMHMAALSFLFSARSNPALAVKRLADPQMAEVCNATTYFFLKNDQGLRVNDEVRAWPAGIEGIAKMHAKALLKAVPGALAQHRKRFGDVSNARLSFLQWSIVHSAADAGWFHLGKDIEVLPHEFAPATGWQGVTLKLDTGKGVADEV